MGTGPAIYFPSASADEVVRYAGVYAETELEKALLQVIEDMYERKEVDTFISAVRNIADNEGIPWKITALLHAALREIDPY